MEARRAWRERVGVVLQDSEPEPGLSVRECLELYAGYYRAPRSIDDTIALVGLTDKAGTLGTQLSGGQRRRLDVALALIGDPELIFLDEPTTGFDPSARRAAWAVIAGLRNLGKTILLTTHFMDEAEYLADRIAVIVAGQIVAGGTPRTLGGRDRRTAAIRFTLPDPLAVRDLPTGLRPLAEVDPNGTTVVRSESPLVHVQMLADWALGRGVDLPDLDVRRPTLEDVYLSLTDPNSAKDHQMNLLGMALHQFRYDLRAFLRNRQSQFFTLALPVLFLVIFASVFGGNHDTVQVAGGRIDTSVYYVPGIIALGIIAASFINLVISVTAQREAGVLKRRRATPVPASAVIAGRALTAVVTALCIAAVLLGIGWVGYHAHVSARTAPALVATVVIGTLSFCCLGYALASVIHDQDSAQPVTQAVMLPLYFISGVFVAAQLAAALAGQRGRRLPGPPSRRRAPDCVQPAHHRVRVRRHRPADRGGMGPRGAGGRPPPVQLAARRAVTDAPN